MNQLSNSMQRLLPQRNPLPSVQVVSWLAGKCLMVQWPGTMMQQSCACGVSGLCHFPWNRYDSKLVGSFPQVLPFYKVCGRSCSYRLAAACMMLNTLQHQTFSLRPSQKVQHSCLWQLLTMQIINLTLLHHSCYHPASLCQLKCYLFSTESDLACQLALCLSCFGLCKR